jgi:hypothetical protein
MATPLAGTPSRRRAPRLAALIALCASGSIFALSCSDNRAATSSGGAATTASAASSSSAAAAASSGLEVPNPIAAAVAAGTAKGDDEKLLFPQDGKPPEPLALRYCQAIHDMEPKRRGDCCGQPGGAGYFTAECARTLSISLRSKASTLDAAAVEKCEAALDKEMQGCGWVGPSPPPLPDECSGIVHGTLAAGAVCRSSLECAEGQRCQTLTATRAGRCAAPKPTGLQCGGATDSLAAFTRQNALDAAHPECMGYCARLTCKDAVAVGAACTASEECGPKGACVGGKCSADGLPKLGDACVDKCASGARCVKSKCAAPKAEGEACESDVECLGACDKPEGAAAGKCAKRCVVMTIPTKPAFSVKTPPVPKGPAKR